MLGLDGIMRQAQDLQAKMAKLQEELGSKTVSASSGGGMVTATCSGKQEILSVSIDKSIIDPEDPAMLEALVLSAVNEALRRSRELMGEEMRALTGGLNIPGLTL